MNNKYTLSNTKIFLIGLICVLVVVAVIARIPHWSLETVTLSSVTANNSITKKEDGLIKLNRGLGTAYIFKNGLWELIKNQEPIVPTKLELADEQRIVGKASFDQNGYGQTVFNVFVYNGTRWRITAIKIDISVKCTVKANNFERNYYEKVDIAPFSEGVVTFNITKPSDFETFGWGIIGEYGVPELPEEKSN